MRNKIQIILFFIYFTLYLQSHFGGRHIEEAFLALFLIRESGQFSVTCGVMNDVLPLVALYVHNIDTSKV